jgi:hypothetical protein
MTQQHISTFAKGLGNADANPLRYARWLRAHVEILTQHYLTFVALPSWGVFQSFPLAATSHLKS